MDLRADGVSVLPFDASVESVEVLDYFERDSICGSDFPPPIVTGTGSISAFESESDKLTSSCSTMRYLSKSMDSIRPSVQSSIASFGSFVPR